MKLSVTLKRMMWATVVVTLSMSSAGAWDFDRTRAADIVDRAANLGDPTARLLLAMAIDRRVSTPFDHYVFEMPEYADRRQLHIPNMNAREIYETLMTGSGQHATREGGMAYAILGAHAMYDRDFPRAQTLFLSAEAALDQVSEASGFSTIFLPTKQDAQVGQEMVIRCMKLTTGLNDIDLRRYLASRHYSELAAKYLETLEFRNYRQPHGINNRTTRDCWLGSPGDFTVVVPSAPFNYAENHVKRRGVLQ